MYWACDAQLSNKRARAAVGASRSNVVLGPSHAALSWIHRIADERCFEERTNVSSVMYSEKLPRPMHSNQNVKLSEAPSDGLRVDRSNHSEIKGSFFDLSAGSEIEGVLKSTSLTP